MIDWQLYFVSFIAGTALGVAFFAGLWLTVRKAIASSRPAIWFGASLLIRIALVLAGFYWATGQQWQRMMVSFSGFLLSRVLVLYVTKRISEKKTPAKEGGHDEFDL